MLILFVTFFLYFIHVLLLFIKFDKSFILILFYYISKFRQVKTTSSASGGRDVLVGLFGSWGNIASGGLFSRAYCVWGEQGDGLNTKAMKTLYHHRSAIGWLPFKQTPTETYLVWFDLYIYYKSSPLHGPFLAPAESFSLRLHRVLIHFAEIFVNSIQKLRKHCIITGLRLAGCRSHNLPQKLGLFWFGLYIYYKSSPLHGPFLAPAESCSLRLHQVLIHFADIFVNGLHLSIY